jgi:predicted GIY-YIG superfamily endonuclease
MCPDRRYYVYILASDSRVLYTGVTNDLHRFESTPDVRAAIAARR